MNNNNIFFDFVNYNFYPEFVYILGFIWADGYIYNSGYHNKVAVEIKSEDAKALSKIFLKTGVWKKSSRIRITNRSKIPRETTRLQISNKDLVKFLIENGFKDKSKSSQKILSAIPQTLHPYWFRGLLDGDGCYYIADGSGKTRDVVKIMVAGPINQNWDSLKEFCDNLEIHSKIAFQKQKTGNGSQFQILQQRDIFTFINVLFNKQDHIWLKRKYDKTRKIISYIKNKSRLDFKTFK